MFLCFSTIGLVFNIITATHNVYLSLPASSRTPSSILKPLSRLSPWIIHTTAMLTWLYAKESTLLRTTLFIPFAFTWGLSFAHHVQLLILAHLTKSKFPAAWKHPLLMLSILGSLDANKSRIFGGSSSSWIQSTEERTKNTVLVCLGLALIVYSHFVYEVIGDICAFYDIKSVLLPCPQTTTTFRADPVVFYCSCLTIKRKSADSKSPADLAKQIGADQSPAEQDKPASKVVPTKAGVLKNE